MRICSCCTDILFSEHCFDNGKLSCVNVSAAAACFHITCAADKEKYLLCNCHTLVRVFFDGEALNQSFKLSRFVKSHCIMQRIYVSYAFYIGERGYFVRNLNIKPVLRIEQVGGYPKLANAARCAVLAGKDRGVSDRCFRVRPGVDIFITKANRGYSKLGKSFHFALARNAVPVRVDPDAQAVKNFVSCVDNSVAVAVILGESFKAVFRSCSVGKQSLISEKLSAVVDRAVSVEIKTEETVLLCPVYLLGKAVFVKIKICAKLLLLYVISVAVKVEDQGIVASLFGGANYFTDFFHIFYDFIGFINRFAAVIFFVHSFHKRFPIIIHLFNKIADKISGFFPKRWLVV